MELVVISFSTIWNLISTRYSILRILHCLKCRGGILDYALSMKNSYILNPDNLWRRHENIASNFILLSGLRFFILILFFKWENIDLLITLERISAAFLAPSFSLLMFGWYTESEIPRIIMNGILCVIAAYANPIPSFSPASVW